MEGKGLVEEAALELQNSSFSDEKSKSENEDRSDIRSDMEDGEDGVRLNKKVTEKDNVYVQIHAYHRNITHF